MIIHTLFSRNKIVNVKLILLDQATKNCFLSSRYTSVRQMIHDTPGNQLLVSELLCVVLMSIHKHRNILCSYICVTIYDILSVQSLVLQMVDSTELPSQELPPYIGAGLLQ